MGYHDIMIIDDGVNGGYLGGLTLKYDLEVTRELEIKERQQTGKGTLSHGTLCAAILSKYAPEASIGSIKVLASKLSMGSSRQLETALKWCLGQEPMLVSLSLGTVQSKDFDGLRILLSGLYRKGFVIIAAYDNQLRYTVPASLECVIGVRCKPSAEGGYRVTEGRFEAYVEACCRHKLTAGDGWNFTTPDSNSYAAPYVTALVHNGLPEDFTGGIWGVWALLGGEAGKSFCHFPDFLDRAEVADLDGGEWPELFYFETADGSGTGEPGSYSENKYIVVLAEGTEGLQKKLAKAVLEESIRGIFCCWEDNHLREKVSQGLGDRIWQEGDYLVKYKYCEGTGEIEVPVVYLYGERKQLIMLLQALRKMFQGEGYDARTVGQFRRAYLYGLEYIDDILHRPAILSNVYKRFDCDIILCGVVSREVVHDVEDADFWLWEEPTEAEGIINIGREVDYMEAVFDRILRLFL